MKILRTLVAAVAVLATFSSCYKEEPVTFPESIEGLWASSGCDLSAGKQTMYLLEISDNSSRLVSLILGKGFTSVVEKENMDVDITFNSSKGKGHITGHGRQETSYEFGVSKDGQMMFIRKDGGTESQSMTNNNYYLYANNAVEMAKDFKAGRKTIGIAWLERHGFLWMEQWFKQWDTYYSAQLWVRTDITERY